MKLNYKKYGNSGKPLVILHGLLGSLDNWQTLARRWEDTFTVYTLDQRNHGKSPHNDDFSYEAMTEDLLEFCKNMELKRINLIGHSMGGKTAMLFALKYPNLVEKLVVADIGPVTYKGGHEFIFEAMEDLPIDKISNRAEAEEFMTTRIPSIPVRKFVLKNLKRKEGGRNYLWKVNLDEIIDHYPYLLGFDTLGLSFKGPVLFLKGQHSDYIDPEDLDEYRLIFPDAGLGIIDNAGHWLHAENPEQFFTAVNNFIG